MFIATFEINPAPPATPQAIIAKEETESLAIKVGLVRAVQAAGWDAFIFGEAKITHVESGRVWTLTCSPNQSGR